MDVSKKHSAQRDAAGRKGPNSTSSRSANLPRPLMVGAFSSPWGLLAVAHTSFRFSPSKVRHGDIYLAPGGDTMAPKPERARLAYIFGIVLAIAVTIPAITTLLAMPSSSPIYHPQVLLLY